MYASKYKNLFSASLLLAGLIAILLCLSVLFCPKEAFAAQQNAPENSNAVYRLYNYMSSEHLFTTDKTEYDNLLKLTKQGKSHWKGEGLEWYAPSASNTSVSKTAVYRLYNKALGKMGRCSHYYTSDASEIKSLTSKYGWKQEKLAFYSGGNAPIFTAYSEALGSQHHYTSDKTEWENLDSGWDHETSKQDDSVTWNTTSHKSQWKRREGFFKALSVPNMTAFAIYSNDDKKLIFYKRVISSLPKIGSKYMGRTVSGIRKNAESSIDEIQDVSFTKDKVWGINFKDTYCPTNTSHWFDGFSGMDVPNGLAKIDTSQVTNMSYMFYGCNNMKFFFVNWWDTSKVTDMSYMFGRCYWMALETGWNLQFWDTSNVKNMEGMFIFCSYCSTLTIEHWNTSKVENMYMMFWGCKSIYKLDLSKWNVANVTDHSYFKETESDIVEPNWVS